MYYILNEEFFQKLDGLTCFLFDLSKNLAFLNNLLSLEPLESKRISLTFYYSSRVESRDIPQFCARSSRDSLKNHSINIKCQPANFLKSPQQITHRKSFLENFYSNKINRRKKLCKKKSFLKVLRSIPWENGV